MVEISQYDDLTRKIIGCAMNVHSVLGNGFQEVIYQKALGIELEDAGIHFKREQEIPVHYKEHEIGSRRAYFIAEDCVLVELKAITKIEDVHFAQIINYLTAYKLEVGLLINSARRA